MTDSSSSFQEKSHQATAHRIAQARKKGDIPRSKEIYHSIVFFTLWGILSQGMGLWFFWLRQFFEAILFTSVLEENFLTLLGVVLVKIFGFLGLMWGGVLGVASLQTQGILTLPPMTLQDLSWRKGIQKIFSRTNGEEFLKHVGKTTVIVGGGGYLFYTLFFSWMQWHHVILEDCLTQGYQTFQNLIVWTGGLSLIFAGIDYKYQGWKYQQKLRMSTQDLKEEFKETEGNPQIRQKQKQQQRDMMHQGQALQRLRDASVLIMNPTHYAVALQWSMRGKTPPIVLVKGRNDRALTLRHHAVTWNIPVVTQPALARLLYNHTELSRPIPGAYYRAVAQVMRYVMKIQPQRIT